MQARNMENFEVFWELFDPDPEFNNRRRACRQLWEQKGAQQQAIIDFLKSGKQRSSRNPYYFLADFRVRRQQIQTLSYADYYARYAPIDSRADPETFSSRFREITKSLNLEIAPTWLRESDASVFSLVFRPFLGLFDKLFGKRSFFGISLHKKSRICVPTYNSSPLLSSPSEA